VRKSQERGGKRRDSLPEKPALLARRHRDGMHSEGFGVELMGGVERAWRDYEVDVCDSGEHFGL
jgi:hypothetical protein